MKAVVQDRYGAGDVFELREVERPTPKSGEVLIRVAAASLHAGDYFLATGVPYVMRLGTGLRRPKKAVPGFDVSGYVEQLGENVTDFRRQQGRPFFAPVRKTYLLELKELVEAGHVRPVIHNTYVLSETAQAMAEVGAGHVCGKVLVTIEQPSSLSKERL